MKKTAPEANLGISNTKQIATRAGYSSAAMLAKIERKADLIKDDPDKLSQFIRLCRYYVKIDELLQVKLLKGLTRHSGHHTKKNINAKKTKKKKLLSSLDNPIVVE